MPFKHYGIESKEEPIFLIPDITGNPFALLSFAEGLKTALLK